MTFLTVFGAAGLLAAAALTPRHDVRVLHVKPFAAYGDLDCNGYSPVQRPLKPIMACADLSNEDNGHYVGHDETEIQFYSSAPKSGSDLQWAIKLPVDPSLPKTQTFENEIAFWWLTHHIRAISDNYAEIPNNGVMLQERRKKPGNGPAKRGAFFIAFHGAP